MKQFFQKVANSKYFAICKKVFAHIADIALDDHAADFEACRKKSLTKWLALLRLFVAFYLRYLRALHVVKGAEGTRELRQALHDRQAEARFLLALMGVFDGDMIPQNLFKYCTGLSFRLDN